MENTIHYIKIPVEKTQEENIISLIPSEETYKTFEPYIFFVAKGGTLEEAEKDYFNILNEHIKWLQEEHLKLNCWKPLRLGPWENGMGKWFSVFGMHFYFRIGKGMQGGFYIPFTNLNISFNNNWKTLKKWKKN